MARIKTLKMIEENNLIDIKNQSNPNVNQKTKPPSYIFGDFLGKIMSKVDLRTQLEASMLSMSLMSVGLVITISYLVIYLTFPLWYKILLVINGLAGLLFMWSNIVTSYQQYLNFMEVRNFQEGK